MRNIMTVSDLPDLLPLFKLADDMSRVDREVERGRWFHGEGKMRRKILTTLFLEPSTRTRLSFESAMLSLDGQVLSAADPGCLSVAKGESISDTLHAVGVYSDLIVVRATARHEDWLDDEFKDLPVPVINAGDGPFNHPTQALLDLYTIWIEYGKPAYEPFPSTPLTHCVIGDIANSRAIRSYLELMSRQSGAQFYLFDTTGHNGKVREGTKIAPHAYRYITDEKQLKEVLRVTNVVYLNRVQRERWLSGLYKEEFSFTEEMAKLMPSMSIIMNPGPRQKELPTSLIGHPRVRMHQQIVNGLYVRMALIHKLLDRTPADML